MIAQFMELLERIPAWLGQIGTLSGFLTVLSMVIIAIGAVAFFFYWDAIAAQEEGRTPLHCIVRQRIGAAVRRPRNRTKMRHPSRRTRPGAKRPTVRN